MKSNDINYNLICYSPSVPVREEGSYSRIKPDSRSSDDILYKMSSKTSFQAVRKGDLIDLSHQGDQTPEGAAKKIKVINLLEISDVIHGISVDEKGVYSNHNIEIFTKRFETPLKKDEVSSAPPVIEINPEGKTLNEALDELAKIMVSTAFNSHQGNISQTARELGLTRRGLYLQLDKLKLPKIVGQVNAD